MSQSNLDEESITTADRIINAVCSSTKVTAEGKRWLKLALDPFPDETRTCGGFPDMVSSKSNVVPFKLAQSISNASGQPWDCLIAFNGVLESAKVRTTGQTGNKFGATGQGVVDYDLGGLQVRTGAVGANLDPTTISANLFAGTPTDRPWRLISSGVEVHNTTSALNKQGAVLCFRQPTVPGDKFTGGITDAAVTSVAPVTVMSMTKLPQNLADVQNIPDSTNWAAEEGAYIVFAMDGPTNPVNYYPEATGMSPAPRYQDNAGQIYFPQISGASPNQVIANSTNSFVPFNNCGMFFTGLSPTTTLELCWHLVIEEFPPPTDRTLMALSDPSAAYDPEALVLYARALRQLPIAVRISENGLGTFFLEAAKSIASWAAPKLLKGLDDPAEKKEDAELAKIKAELQILRELQLQQRSMKQPAPQRVVVASPSGNAKIVPIPAKVKPLEKQVETRTRVVTNSTPTSSIVMSPSSRAPVMLQSKKKK